MFRTKTLNDITYKDKWLKVDSPIDVDDKDVEKLVRMGAIDSKGIIPETDKFASREVKINVIKNSIKIEKENEDIELPPETIEKIHKEDKRIKRKYNRRDKNFKQRGR